MSSILYFLYPKTARKLTKILFVTVIVSATLGMVFNLNKEIKPLNITVISGTINRPPVLVKKENSANSLSIYLQEFPGKKFEFGEEVLQTPAINQFINTVSEGDQVILEIKDYSISDTIRSIFQSIGLKYQDQTILSSKEHRQKQMEDKFGVWVIAILVGILLSIYLILDFSGVISKYQTWFNKQQTSLSDYRKKTTINDFNEIEMDKPTGCR